MLGIEASPSFVREPRGNGVAERFIRNPEGEPPVGQILRHHRELRAELIAFAKRYNKPGSSSGTDIKHPLKCEPLNFGLPRQMSESYPWQPE